MTTVTVDQKAGMKNHDEKLGILLHIAIKEICGLDRPPRPKLWTSAVASEVLLIPSPMELYINNAHGGLPTLLPFKRLSGWFGGQVRMNFIVQRKLPRGISRQELSGRTTTFLSNSQAIQALQYRAKALSANYVYKCDRTR